MCLRCPHREFRDLREKAFDDQVSVLGLILKDAPQWKHSMFNSLTDLCWARVVQAPDDTEHLWRGLLPGDISLYIPPNVLETPIDSEDQLRQLRRDIKNFLQPLADATQDMLSTRGRLYHCAPPPTPAPSTGAAAPAPPPPDNTSILRMPAFVITRTRRQLARQSQARQALAQCGARQSRIRIVQGDPSAERPGGNFTLQLCSIQDLINTGWSARGIRISFGSNPQPMGSQSSEISGSQL